MTKKRSLAEVVAEKIEEVCPDTSARFKEAYIVKRPGDIDLTPNEQLKAVNHYWRTQLGSLSVSTIAERECLADDVPIADWLHAFDEWVLPTVIEHRIPHR